jgi:hypothetical protein
MLRRPDAIPPVALDGLEPMAEGAEESWGEWSRWYMSRHRSPINQAAHIAGFGLLIASPVVALARRKWWLLPVVAGAGLACIAAGHALEGNMPTVVADPRRFFGKPLGAVKSSLRPQSFAENEI